MFRSYFFAGFECSTGYNSSGQWIDQIAATHHDRHAESDYRLLREAGLHAVREAMRWPIIERAGRYDFKSVEPFVRAANQYDIEIIWDLFHYGYPQDVDLFSTEFPERFASYCAAAAEFVSARMRAPNYFTPINEPSYFAWAAGEVGRFAPYCVGRGVELKAALVRAVLRGIDGIRSVLPSARMVNVDPLCYVVAPRDRPELAEQAEFFNNSVVFEAWDMIRGNLRPELGGSAAHLDIVGINYYWLNQWELGSENEPLSEDDPRRVPLSQLIQRVFERYSCDLLITETAHVDDMRPVWLHAVAEQAEALLKMGIPLRGVCLYPIIGMPEWHDRSQWTRMGLWDLVSRNAQLYRELCRPMFDALLASHRLNQSAIPVTLTCEHLETKRQES